MNEFEEQLRAMQPCPKCGEFVHPENTGFHVCDAGALTVKTPEPQFLLQIFSAEPLVSIKPDGTVVIHQEGGDKEAAKKFYEALELEGRTLHDRIAKLEKQHLDIQSARAVEFIERDRLRDTLKLADALVEALAQGFDGAAEVRLQRYVAARDAFIGVDTVG